MPCTTSIRLPTFLIASLAMLTTLLSIAAAPAQAQGLPEIPVDSELAFIERLYRDGDAYRAESEALRFVHAHPRHVRRVEVDLVRAKLYYRAERYDEANLMLYGLLDRLPPLTRSPGRERQLAVDARRLLAYAQLRQGDTQRAAESMTHADRIALEELTNPPEGSVDPDTAEAWSTWIPGSGYFVLGEPGKAAAAITLNLALLGLVALSADQDNAPAAVLFLALEAMLWQGGRSGVRQDAEAHNRRLERQRLEGWLAERGEPELLRVGFSASF